jgi:hypothetical protein
MCEGNVGVWAGDEVVGIFEEWGLEGIRKDSVQFSGRVRDEYGEDAGDTKFLEISAL